MAASQNCPSCGLVNPSGTAMCDCGHDFTLPRPQRCQGCGLEAETRYVAFYQVIGAVVVLYHTSVAGQLCKSCINKHFWGKTTTTMLLGWWGLISFIITPFVLVNNVVRYMLCIGMVTPPTGSEAIAEFRERGRPQLVGQHCVHCGERILSRLDGRYCAECEAPVHHRCARTEADAGCRSCGATG
jgi:hypothetical protein